MMSDLCNLRQGGRRIVKILRGLYLCVSIHCLMEKEEEEEEEEEEDHFEICHINYT